MLQACFLCIPVLLPSSAFPTRIVIHLTLIPEAQVRRGNMSGQYPRPKSFCITFQPVPDPLPLALFVVKYRNSSFASSGIFASLSLDHLGSKISRLTRDLNSPKACENNTNSSNQPGRASTTKHLTRHNLYLHHIDKLRINRKFQTP